MARNIVVCCDGTGNRYGKHNTNVVKLFEIIQKNVPEQIAYYDPGVGTFSANSAVTVTGRAVTRALGSIVGLGLIRNIEDAYEYLMDHYRDGDRVFLFGFSRGAFTVLALAAMLHKCGLLQKGSRNLIPYATRMYRHGDPDVAEGFKAGFARPCRPHFVGVWDTVKSVGLLWSRTYPIVGANPDIQHGAHALAIDEKRWKFKPTLWPPGEARLEQVWFAGVHSDVGGWYDEAGLSNIALHWMIDRAGAHGLRVDPATRAEARFRTSHSDRLHDSLRGGVGPFRWWMIGWRRRNIPVGAAVHASAIDRMKEPDLHYRPGNLPRQYDPVQ